MKRAKWAFYLSPYEVALAATQGVEAAKKHIKDGIDAVSITYTWSDEEKRRRSCQKLEKVLKEHFKYQPPYAVDSYCTAYAQGLEHLTCKCDGISGRPNAILLLNENKLALLQFRNNIDEIAILQAVGLNLIMRCNKKRIAKKFYNKPPQNVEISGTIYFLTKEKILEHLIESSEEDKFKSFAKELRQKLALG
ncbi:MAG: hypothetical protein QW063_01140 [Candidatus Nanoarchaeia archaeon]